MAGSQSLICDSRSGSGSGSGRFNPWVLNFQKLGLELKCPLCLNLLNRPMLLPCNHVFCYSCIPGSTQFGAECPVCQAHFVDQDPRHLPFLENMATIYRCLDATCSTNLFLPVKSEGGGVLLQNPTSTMVRFDDKMSTELAENGKENNSHSGQSINTRVGVEKNDKIVNSCTAVDATRLGIEFRGAVIPNSSPRSQFMTMDVDAKAVLQPAPDSPPSFGDAKCSDNDSYYPWSEHSSENSMLKRPTQENDGAVVGKLKNYSSSFENDNDVRDVKRHKQLNCGLVPLDPGRDAHIQPVFHSKLEQTVLKAGLQEPNILDVNKYDCVFCHSSKITEDTGSMLHYSNEKLVIGHEASFPNVIHVHKVCIDWAPQVFYEDDIAKNLNEEVARGAKLKCSACGLKGAALGCYVRTCRKSYHVPCAMRISKCRWNHEQYLVLCPAHSYVKFPNEKSKAKPKKALSDRPLPTIVSCQLSNKVALPGGDINRENILVLCGSALSSEEKILLVTFGKMKGAAVSKFWSPNVSHVIAATDEKGACTRTLKVLMAISNGRWIVNVDWVKACMESKYHVDEEPYEVILDNYGCYDGPKNGRLRASSNAPKLFSGLNFYFLGDFLPSYKDDLQDLVIAAGGTVLESREELATQRTDQQAVRTPKAFVVYNIDPPEGCKLGDEVSILWQRLSEAEDIASRTGAQVIGHTWLLESIAGYKLQPVVS
ncbi:BRCA1-associated RING domain protein 1 [Humulus lupulus]|uniref:BRCA1-associated RING domain protein 1 n=1 Tax=Humulus lupulus TaxID=3486 RepID=UPI002B405444|nr:BRCA1-associated RING domain protein 1 [Humulus lupulus]